MKYHMGSNPCEHIIFKLLLQKSIIYTSFTASNMRENLYSIYTYITMVNSDIEKFNEYAKISYEALIARGERCDNMMSKNFKVYHNTVDK